MMNPLISIIVPCYNQALYLPETLQSVLDQSFSEWECIIVNDGSPDNTEEIALSWCDKDSRFIYLHKDNGGLSDARNKGIEIAKGKYVLPLDSDDKLSSTYIQEAINIFEKDEETKLVYPRVVLFGSQNREWGIKDYSYENLLWFNMLVCSSIFRKEDLLKVGGYNTEMKLGWEDWDLWLRLLKSEDKVVKLPSAIFYYRMKESSMITDINESDKNKQQLYWQIFNNHRELYQEQESYISCMLRKNDLEQAYNWMINSQEFKIGNIMLKPVRFIKTLFRRKL